MDWPSRRQPLESVGLNILLLTSEFAPAMGGIGTYAREIAAAATRLGAKVTVVAPDYAQQTADDDEALPFKVVRFRGGLHTMRDMPGKIMLARRGVRGGHYDVVHAADWPFFIPLALSRWRTPARVLMTVHGTEINETQTPLKRAAIRGAGVFGPRTEIVANSRFTETLFRQRFAVDPRKISAINLGVSDFWFGGQKRRREVRLAHRLLEDRLVMITVARITRRKGHHLTLAALARLPDDLRQSHHMARGRTGRRSRLCQQSAARCQASGMRCSFPRLADERANPRPLRGFGFLLPDGTA